MNLHIRLGLELEIWSDMKSYVSKIAAQTRQDYCDATPVRLALCWVTTVVRGSTLCRSTLTDPFRVRITEHLRFGHETLMPYPVPAHRGMATWRGRGLIDKTTPSAPPLRPISRTKPTDTNPSSLISTVPRSAELTRPRQNLISNFFHPNNLQSDKFYNGSTNVWLRVVFV